MKTLIFLFASFCFMIASCTKPAKNRTTTPAPLSFEIIGKNGESLITSLTDKVSIAYIENGITKTQGLYVVKLQVSNTDTTSLTKYNGLVITDNTFMSDISSRKPNPIHNFNIYLNGVNLGSIYLDYWAYEGAYTEVSSNLTFNNIPVKTVNNYDYYYYPGGSNIILLQL